MKMREEDRRHEREVLRRKSWLSRARERVFLGMKIKWGCAAVTPFLRESRGMHERWPYKKDRRGVCINEAHFKDELGASMIDDRFKMERGGANDRGKLEYRVCPHLCSLFWAWFYEGLLRSFVLLPRSSFPLSSCIDHIWVSLGPIIRNQGSTSCLLAFRNLCICFLGNLYCFHGIYGNSLMSS